MASPFRTETYPSDQRAGYLGSVDPTTALRIYGAAIELPFLAGLQCNIGSKGLGAGHAVTSAADATATVSQEKEDLLGIEEWLTR